MKKIVGEKSLSPVIASRLTQTSYDLLRKNAKEMGISFSAYLRIFIDRTLKQHNTLPSIIDKKAS